MTAALSDITQKAKQLWDLVNTPFRVVKFVWNLYRNGQVEVVTPFQYQNETYSFRTVIQPDADILMYIPDPEKFASNRRSLQLLQKQHKAHLQQVTEFVGVLQHNSQAMGRVTDVTVYGTNAALVLQQFKELKTLVTSQFQLAQTEPTVWYAVGFSVFSLAYAFYLKPHVVAWVFKGLYALLRFFLKFRG